MHDDFSLALTTLVATTPTAIQSTTNPFIAYIASLQSANSQRTIEKQLHSLATMMGFADAHAVPWAQLRVEHTQALWAKLASSKSASTANLMLSALRGVLKMAWRMGLMTGEDYTRVVDLKTVKGNAPDAAAGRSLTAAELRALFAACAADPSPVGRRDAAILALAYAAGGLRRAEIVNLDLADFNPETAMLTIRGKGNKVRTAYVRGGARDALDEWLAVRGDEAGPLFWRLQAGGVAGQMYERLSDQAIYILCQRRGKEANVRHFSPHDIRRTFISDQLDAGTDVLTVARLAGHSNANTTSRYDRRGERAKQAAADALHVPFVSQETFH